MDCTLLGSGGMMPMPHRLLTSLAVRHNGSIILFDAGEGAQLGWKKAKLGYRALQVIAVSHLHADHCLGIPGLMMLRAQMDAPEPLTIVGPPGIEEFVSTVRRILDFYLNFPVHFVEWSESHGSVAFEDEHVRLIWHPLKHTRLCLGFRLEEKDRSGKFDARKARELGIPEGPLWGRLQKGESVQLGDARIVLPREVLGPSRRGRHIAYVVDTRPTKNIYTLCNGVDLAFLEGMFLRREEEHAWERGHMTVWDAARIARRAEVRDAVLVHVSPRYGEEDLIALEKEAREQFSQARMGRDLDVYAVGFPDDD